MSIYKEKIVDIVTGEETWRDYTPEEIAAVEKAIAEGKAKAEAVAKKSEAKTALLEKMGITEEEARLLLG